MTPSRITPGSGRLRLGELLVKAGVITEMQLLAALQEQKQWGGKLGDLLVRMNYMSEDIFVRALSKQLGLSRADLALDIPPAALATLPEEWVQKHETVPISLVEDGKTLVVATSDPLNFALLDDARSLSGLRVVAQVAGTSAIRNAISRAYRINPTRDERPVRVERPTASVAPPSRADTTAAFRSHASPPPPPAEITSPISQVDGPPTSPPIARSDPRLSRVAGSDFVVVNEPAGGTPSPSRSPVGNASTQTVPPARPPAPASQSAASQAPPSRPAGPPNPAFFTPPHGLPVPVPRAPVGASDDAQRQAMKALVELLVSKGVFSLDEYLNRLKR